MSSTDASQHQLRSLQALIRDEKFLVIGHRGAAGLAPENTLPSFQRAFNLGCQMVELDVHRLGVKANLTSGANSKLAVLHDSNLKRTTNKTGLIENLSVKDLAEIDAGEGNPIPTLDQVIELTRSITAAWINVELKGKETALATYQNLEQQAFTKVLVSSFDHAQLFAYRALDEHVPISPLFHRWNKNGIETAQALSAFSINLSLKIAKQALVEEIRKSGFEVFVYTVNDPKVAARLYDYGVNGVFTDYPDRVTKDRVIG